MARKPKAAQEGAETSIADIAATLVKDSDPEAYVKEVEKDDFADDVDDTDEVVDDETLTGGDDETEDEETDALETEDEAEEDVEDVDEVEDEAEYLDITDDDLIVVKVDDEEQEVSIGDLKKAYSGEGAIEKRLQQATEARTNSIQESTKLLETLADNERLYAEALQGLDETLFKGVIPAPPDDLKRSNPSRYLQHQEAYENDQKRINDAKAVIQGAISEAEKARADRLEKYTKQASMVIAQQIPELASDDDDIRNGMYKKLFETAQAYYYTEAEIKSALDPRMYMLIRDATKYREMMSGGTQRDPKDLAAQKVKKVRRLRSGNTTVKNRTRQADRDRKARVERARKSGKVEDVAATLVGTAPKR